MLLEQQDVLNCERVAFRFYELAIFEHDGYSGKKRVYSHETLMRGCVVSTHVELWHEKILLPIDDGLELAYCVIERILKINSNQPWCFVKDINKRDTETYTVQSNMKALCMGPNVRRVATIHFCASQCQSHRREGKIVHENCILNGGLWKIIGKRGGYPPHLG